MENFNTYGLSVKFLEGLGITQGPLHTKVFVANVSIQMTIVWNQGSMGFEAGNVKFPKETLFKSFRTGLVLFTT